MIAVLSFGQPQLSRNKMMIFILKSSVVMKMKNPVSWLAIRTIRRPVCLLICRFFPHHNHYRQKHHRSRHYFITIHLEQTWLHWCYNSFPHLFGSQSTLLSFPLEKQESFTALSSAPRPILLIISPKSN